MEARRRPQRPVLPGAQSALERLGSIFRLGLATSAAPAVAQAVLGKTGWAAHFAVTVSADDVQRGKPAPDVYVRALELMGADPRRAAAIEDSANGIRSAHAAGLAVIVIPNRTFPPDRQSMTVASRILTSLEELNVETIEAALRKAAS